LASFVKATEKPELDCYDISCMNMASTLRNIANYDDVLAQEFKMKVDQLQLEATQEVIRFKRGSQD
uniref:Transcriptional regulator n=1 Tax=Heligmosomoides polygyrus TaxID=6339 RepID=A0A183G2L8_HELPZ